ncbi:hypothetical protein V5O48_004797 [Marasmius crinis-equi]|uniref:tRNA-dihydrouridine(16/17) synthase [NAD(P)(+)] n=1 Tax=Marasmius crinis-equi TaxID=585013 RepID=A0ABR3FP67_9AGAR
MLNPEQILSDQEYLEFHRRDLAMRREEPVVVQLCGNDPQVVVEAGKKLQDLCQGIGEDLALPCETVANDCYSLPSYLDLNLGCPQQAAQEGHFGAYLLAQKDWPLVETIVSSMAHSFITPVSTKIRLCQPAEKTLDFVERLQAQGSAWVTLHARTVSARRRRQGAADLSQVKRIKDSPAIHVPIISNGNVRCFSDLSQNLSLTGADGLMVGETLLGNPW